MKPRSRTARLGTAAAFLVVATTCSGTRTTKLCASDADCGDPVNLYCDTTTGYCLCKTNAGCATGQVCNRAGFCVAQSRCTSNADCPQSQYCDTVTSTCVNPGRCALDSQCPFGQVCDVNTSVCVTGCRTHGDCPLGQACICPLPDGGADNCQCPPGSPATRSTCPQMPGPDGGIIVLPPGQCTSSRCGDTSFCEFGFTCEPPTPGAPPQCVNTFDPQTRPFCANCVPGPGGTSCGQGANFCLVAFDPMTNAPFNFCGVDCSQGQSCPNGYSCQDVIVVLQRWQCATNVDCQAVPSAVTCQTDADCPNGSLCTIPPGATTGACHGQCETSEGTAQGFCSCVVDSDCFQDTCDSVTRTCSISQQPCDPNAVPSVCNGNTRCVDFGSQGGGGGCLIGQNCAPINGLTCSLIAQYADAGL